MAKCDATLHSVAKANEALVAMGYEPIRPGYCPRCGKRKSSPADIGVCVECVCNNVLAAQEAYAKFKAQEPTL